MESLTHAVALAVWLIAAGASPATADGKLDFARDIRPILSQNCFKCHGPDDRQRQAELRLDIESAAFAKREEGFPLVPGKAEESEVWKRITSVDPQERMP